jgi:uncharacterized protein with GYD domain
MMATDESTRGFDTFFAKVIDPPAETYFSLWTITEAGRREPAQVQAALAMASRGLKGLGGRCRLYVTMGGPFDLVGVAKGPVDEQAMLALQRAIQASGVLTTVFFKSFEQTAADYAKYTEHIATLKGS